MSYLCELFSLAGKTAVVIGGTGTLGGAIAVGLGRAGANIVVAGRNQERGEAKVAEIAGHGGHAQFLHVDVDSRQSIDELCQAAIKRNGQVDILINSAGVNHASPYLEVDDADWQRVLDSNLTAVHRTCQIFGAQMKDAGGGAIVNIASVTSDKPLSRVFAYSASKAAVANLTQNVAREFAPDKIRVNALCPGFFPAELNRAILDKERVAHIMAQTPLARFGEPEELVGATLLLVAPAGSFVTGTCVYVDGGFTGMRF
ncbi:MAG: glucose 1-dehydrogenase [Pirellulales bacterium]|nr:glucose 1-dehydrogenase [Pirellulales bacterium]